MNDLYLFGNEAYGIQSALNPMLEAELKKCKTVEEQESVIRRYQSIIIIAFTVTIAVSFLLCGLISFCMR